MIGIVTRFKKSDCDWKTNVFMVGLLEYMYEFLSYKCFSESLSRNASNREWVTNFKQFLIVRCQMPSASRSYLQHLVDDFVVSVSFDETLKISDLQSLVNI